MTGTPMSPYGRGPSFPKDGIYPLLLVIFMIGFAISAAIYLMHVRDDCLKHRTCPTQQKPVFMNGHCLCLTEAQ